jgi:hypothetical protein
MSWHKSGYPHVKTVRVKIKAHKKAPGLSTWGFFIVSGAPGGIRTHDPCLRRAVLYPAELRMLVRATSYPCRPWASMPVFGPSSVGICRAKALRRAPLVNALQPCSNTQIRKFRQMRRFRSFFRTDYCPVPPLILGFV